MGKQLTPLLTLSIVVLVILSTIVESVPPSIEAKTVEVLINNVERLKQVIDFKLEVVNLVLVNVTTPAGQTVSLEINHTLELAITAANEGDNYLNIAKELLGAGNYSGAKVYAVKALQSYSKAIKLLNRVIVSLGINPETCYLIMNRTSPVLVLNRSMNMNRTGITNNSLIIAFERARDYLERLVSAILGLENSLSKLKLTVDTINVEELLSELSAINETIDEGISLATLGNLTEAAELLSKVRRRLSQVKSEIKIVSIIVTVTRVKYMLTLMPLNKTISNKLSIALNSLLDKVRKREIHGIFKELNNIVNKVEQYRRMGPPSSIPPTPPLPPGSGGRTGGSGHGSRGGMGN